MVLVLVGVLVLILVLVVVLVLILVVHGTTSNFLFAVSRALSFPGNLRFILIPEKQTHYQAA